VQIYSVNPEGTLLLSGAVDDWKAVKERGVTTLVDLEGGVDPGLPEEPNGLLYIYFPIADEELPNDDDLQAVGRLVAELVRAGRVVLVHCLLGLNRSNLLVAVALAYLGVPGTESVRRLREIQEGALYNDTFYQYVLALEARSLGGER
jgi:atypical dual specificity phosphatase